MLWFLIFGGYLSCEPSESFAILFAGYVLVGSGSLGDPMLL